MATQQSAAIHIYWALTHSNEHHEWCNREHEYCIDNKPQVRAVSRLPAYYQYSIHARDCTIHDVHWNVSRPSICVSPRSVASPSNCIKGQVGNMTSSPQA